MSVIRHRCLIRQYVIGEFWKLSNPERKKRLTYNRIVNLFNSYNNPEYIHYLNEKTDFNAFFKDFVKRDWVHIDNISKEDLYSFIKDHEEVIIKPINGVEGGGIRKLRFSNDIDINKLYEELKLENVLIEEVIKQNSRMNFGNTAVNTIRTHTFIDKNGKAHITKAILRAGVGDTVVDNYAQGGSIYEVDIQTGLVCTYGQTKDNKKSYIHPGTNIVMLGYQIPNWGKVIETSIKAAEQIPQVGFIGWDVAITSDGTELIEGNHNPDYELFEFLGSTGYYEKINSYLR
jgi:glutathione synthase/RimK-type ligase-like ATP-grasp enzyme